MRRFLRIIWLLACGSLLCLGPAIAAANAPVGLVVVPAGTYENQNYGFSLEVPTALPAYRNAPPNPNHGILIELGKGRKIVVDASFDALFFGSTKAQMDDIVQTNGKLLKRAAASLAGLPAEQAWLRQRQKMLLILAQYRGDGHILYQLRLESTPGAFVKDQRLFAQIAASFRQQPRD